jgi:hypothetical protein
MKPIHLPDWQIARLKSAASILDASPDELASWLLGRLLSGDQLAQIVSEALGQQDDDVRRAESLMVLGMWETWTNEDSARISENPTAGDGGPASLRPGDSRGRLTTPV